MNELDERTKTRNWIYQVDRMSCFGVLLYCELAGCGQVCPRTEEVVSIGNQWTYFLFICQFNLDGCDGEREGEGFPVPGQVESSGNRSRVQGNSIQRGRVHTNTLHLRTARKPNPTRNEDSKKMREEENSNRKVSAKCEVSYSTVHHYCHHSKACGKRARGLGINVSTVSS